MNAIAERVSCRVMADIGTDHAYVPIRLMLAGRIGKAIVCDINDGPLKRAESNILQCGFEGRFDIRLGDGLEPLQPGEAQTLVIAGMGGLLINEILENRKEVVGSAAQLVLQPQRDVPLVRKQVHKLGLHIDDEVMVFDGRYYNILDCSPTNSPEAYTDEEYLLGKCLINGNSAVFLDYLRYELGKLSVLSHKASGPRKEELDALIAVYKKYIKQGEQ